MGDRSDCMINYKTRVSDKLIVRKLKGKGAVLIEGPKWCGKTTSANKLRKVFYIWQILVTKSKMYYLQM